MVDEDQGMEGTKKAFDEMDTAIKRLKNLLYQKIVSDEIRNEIIEEILKRHNDNVAEVRERTTYRNM